MGKIELWSEPETKLLLEKYSEYILQVGPNLQYNYKRKMWEQISKDIFAAYPSAPERSWESCENRYKTIMKRNLVKKVNKIDAVTDSPLTTGHVEIKHEIEDGFEATNEDFLTDVLSDRTTQSTPDTSLSHTKSSSSRRRTHSHLHKIIGNLMETYYEKKEAARERRHREKIKILSNIYDSLQNVQ